jgi:hypothetical protein
MADHIMQYFTYAHLPAPLQEASKPFCELARWIENNIPRNPERTAALRRLLEAKDACVRAAQAGIATAPTSPAGNPTQHE